MLRPISLSLLGVLALVTPQCHAQQLGGACSFTRDQISDGTWNADCVRPGVADDQQWQCISSWGRGVFSPAVCVNLPTDTRSGWLAKCGRDINVGCTEQRIRGPEGDLFYCEEGRCVAIVGVGRICGAENGSPPEVEPENCGGDFTISKETGTETTERTCAKVAGEPEDAPRRCQWVRGEGQPCGGVGTEFRASGICENGLSCVNGKCAAQAAQAAGFGEPCRPPSLPCQSGLKCVKKFFFAGSDDFFCIRIADVGEACEVDTRDTSLFSTSLDGPKTFCNTPADLMPTEDVSDEVPRECVNGVCREAEVKLGALCNAALGFDCDPDGCEGTPLVCSRRRRTVGHRGTPGWLLETCVLKS